MGNWVHPNLRMQLSLSFGLGKGFSLGLAVQVPVLVAARVSVAVTPAAARLPLLTQGLQPGAVFLDPTQEAHGGQARRPTGGGAGPAWAPSMIKRPVRDCSDCELTVQGACVFAPRKLSADAVLTPQDMVADEVSFVRQGVVALTVLTAEGTQAHVAVRGPRSMLGLEALNALPSPAEVTAVTDVQLCVASADRVRAWLGPDTGARRMFELAVGELLEQRRDVDLRSGPAEVRVARFLLLCAAHVGRGKRAPFSKARAASVVGLRPETMSRILARLAARGIVDRSTAVRVLDVEALRAVAAG